jgi:hypothetical protein
LSHSTSTSLQQTKTRGGEAINFLDLEFEVRRITAPPVEQESKNFLVERNRMSPHDRVTPGAARSGVPAVVTY